MGRGIAEVIATARVRIVPRLRIRQLPWNADPETTANYRGILGDLRHLEREPTLSSSAVPIEGSCQGDHSCRFDQT